MRYLSLFSGIEAATVAWAPLGWACVGVSEIDPYGCAALAHHYPNVPNLGDITKITESDIAMLGGIDLVVFGSPCFTAGHTVLTERGLVPIESVVVGDSVWTHASRWKRVTNVMTRIAPTVIVNGQGHNTMRATPDHPFYAAETDKTWNGNGYTRSLAEPQWVNAESMQGKRWATPVNLTCYAGVPGALQGAQGAYLAGLYLGDGHIVRTAGRDKKAVILSVGAAKRDKILPKLRNAWGTVSDMRHGASVWRLQVSRTAIADSLVENFGEYSHAKSIPTWALCADPEWQTSFLQGVLDTDGSAINGGWRVTTVSRALAVGIRLLAARLGYSTSLHFCKRPPTCVIEGRTVNQMNTWTVVMRKTIRVNELRTDEHTWGLVHSVTPAEDAQVYDITVEDDHSFICDGIVVHNCQDLSVAGKRKGLDGARSGLFFTAMQIVGWARTWGGCRFALWENVPGAFSSNKGADFAVVVGQMAGVECPEIPPKGWGTEGAIVGTEAMVEWAVLDAQWAGVAQRRRRVFAVADFGDWASRPPILLEPESMRGDTAPSREAGQGIAGTLASRTGAGGYPGSDEACDGHVIPVGLQRPVLNPEPARVQTHRYGRNAGGMGRIDAETETFIVTDEVSPTLLSGATSPASHGKKNGTDREALVVCATGAVTHTLKADGFDASEDGTGRGTPIVPVLPFDTTQVTSVANRSNPKAGDPCHPLAAGAHAPAIAFTQGEQHGWLDGGTPQSQDDLPAWRMRNVRRCECGSAPQERGLEGPPTRESAAPVQDLPHEGASVRNQMHAVREAAQRSGVLRDALPAAEAARRPGIQADATCLQCGGVRVTEPLNGVLREARSAVQTRDIGQASNDKERGRVHQMAVRRLTPIECERLMGFPDDYTAVPVRGKIAADGPRYKALGNSMCVNVMAWIGRQIDHVTLFY